MAKNKSGEDMANKKLSPRKLYLMAYNSLCLVIWGLIVFYTIPTYLVSSTSFIPDIDLRSLWFDRVGPLVCVATTLSLAEILHNVFRLTRGNAVTTAIQVISRIHVWLFVWRHAPNTKLDVSTLIVVTAWGLSEVIRYPFYICQIASKQIPWLTYLRYSGFLILYPLGIGGEVMTMLSALRHWKRHDVLWPTPMPNRVNFEISLRFLYTLILIAYIPGSPHMFQHMLKQRRKVFNQSSPPVKQD